MSFTSSIRRSAVVFVVAAVASGVTAGAAAAAPKNKTTTPAVAAVPTTATPPTTATLPAVLPLPVESKLAGSARSAIDTPCRAAAATVGSPRAARSEIVSGKGPPGPTPAVGQPVDWYRGEVPRRYVALLVGTRAGQPTRILATVQLRGVTCSLVSWRVSSG